MKRISIFVLITICITLILLTLMVGIFRGGYPKINSDKKVIPTIEITSLAISPTESLPSHKDLLPSQSNNPPVDTNSKLFSDSTLGIKFKYSGQTGIEARKVGNRVYLMPTNQEYIEGIWNGPYIEVLMKNQNDTVPEAINKIIITKCKAEKQVKVSKDDEFDLPNKFIYWNIFNLKDITDPSNEELSCVNDYMQHIWVAASFLEDPNIKDRFAYVVLGQDIEETADWLTNLEFINN